MSSAATGPLIKPLSMANACLTSLPSIFTTTKTSFSFISVPSKSIKPLHISCSSSSSSSGGFPSWVSLKNKNSSSSSSMVAMVSSTTSDWAQTEYSSEVEEDDEGKWENDEGKWENDEGKWENDEGEEEGSSELVSYSVPPKGAKLFVANLPYEVDSQKLAELFQQAGIVEIAEVIYNRQTDQSRGFVFVTMSTIEEAEKAIEMFNRYDINGRLLTVNKDGEKDSRPEQPRDSQSPLRIYVGNLPWEVDSARLEHLFSEFGKVIDARILSDRDTGRSRGFGFVTMSTQAEVKDAVNALNGQDLDGRTIKVNVSEQRERRGSF